MTNHSTMERRFAAALTDPALPVPEGMTSARGMPDRLRFAVYRNTVHVSLVEALTKVFPVTLRLVGDRFFRAMARAYVAISKPDSPVLIRYGASFPDFVAGFPAAERLDYLPDLARLEFAWLEAYHAAEADPCDPRDLAALAPDELMSARLTPHPAARLVESEFAIGSLWSAHQTDTVATVDIGRPETVLLTRPRAQVQATVLPSTDTRFARRLLDGSSVGSAAASACERDPAFDAGRALSGLVALGAFSTTITHSEEPTP